MPKPDSPQTSNGFRISEGPVVRSPADFGLPMEFGDLPRIYGAPLLFAIPRDPQTLFTYWNVDWSSVFDQGEPIDRQVYLRIKAAGGQDEAEVVVEPMLGSHYVTVSIPKATYRVELGYYDSNSQWRSVATSAETAALPPTSPSENFDLDLATLPFHLSFQRLIDLFRASNGDALAEIVSRLQKRALTDEERAMLTPEELEILRAMNVSVGDLKTGHKGFANRADDELLRKRTEAILGFGATSPANPFGDNSSSWSVASS